MGLLKTKHEKKIAQQQRLLREFPWLWSIRHSWSLGFHYIEVYHNVGRASYVGPKPFVELGEFLLSPSSDYPEIWAATSLGQDHLALKQVQPSGSWANAILSCTGVGERFLYIVIVACYIAVGRDTFSICCPPKKQNFNPMLVDLARQSR